MRRKILETEDIEALEKYLRAVGASIDDPSRQMEEVD